jgi:DNA polymerase III sliding clamp (beta) subunit (PCNA family)
MKPIHLPLAELKNALTGLSKIIPRRQTLPILGAVKIERTIDGWVALTATDLEHYATVRLEQPTDGEAATVILPYDELLKTSKVCGKNDTLLVKSEGKQSDTSGILTYAVGGQVVDHRCQSFDAQEFPATPRFKGDSIPLPDALRTSIHEAFQFANNDGGWQL